MGIAASAPAGFAILMLLVPFKWFSRLNKINQNKPCLSEAERKIILNNSLKNVINMKPSQNLRDLRKYQSDAHQKVEYLYCQSEFEMDPSKLLETE